MNKTSLISLVRGGMICLACTNLLALDLPIRPQVSPSGGQPSPAVDLTKPSDAAKQRSTPKTMEEYREMAAKYAEEYRQAEAKKMKAELKMGDEEWTAVQPLIDKVTAKQKEYSALNMPLMGMGWKKGGRAPESIGGTIAPKSGDSEKSRRGGGEPSKYYADELIALNRALQAEESSSDEIKSKLQALRAQRQKIDAELKKLREDLRGVLTAQQEGALVLRGILD